MTDAMNNELPAAGGPPLDGRVRPCPFCGGTSVTVQHGSTFRWVFAGCGDCGAQCGEVRVQTLGPGTPDEWTAQAQIDARAEWNRRA
jgi:Lar family restriction alleviation protein